MKRILPLLLVLPLFAACKGNSNDSKKNDSNNPADNGGEPGAPGSSGGPDLPGVTQEEMNTNPVEGVEAPTAILQADAFTDGPVWHPGLGVLFFSTPLGDGALFRMLPDGRVLKIRDGSQQTGSMPIGNTVNALGELVTVEAKRIVRGPADGEPGVIATGWNGAAPPPPGVDGGAPQGDGTFDTLNDVVSRKDGTLYVTDPGYFVTPIANRIYRIDPGGAVQVVEAFEDVPRPNGISLSPDEKTLYVGFTAPQAGTMPFIRKYLVNDDGTLGEWTKFADLGAEDAAPDGLAVDKVGNVYVATKAGVEAYKPDGTKWGVIAIPEQPTGIAFGGPDLKTGYVTTAGVKIWQFNAKVAGKAK